MSIKIVCLADINEPEKFYNYLCEELYDNEEEYSKDLILRITKDYSFREKIYIILSGNEAIGVLSLLYLDNDWANQYNDRNPWRSGALTNDQLECLRPKLREIQEKHNIKDFKLDL